MEYKIMYDGKYPCLCMGTLTILKDDKEIYKKKFITSTTSSASWDENYNAVQDGYLIWNDTDNQPKELIEKVNSVLKNYVACCGGCI